MKITVTGHLGYIGAILIPMLVSKGHRVSGIDSDLYAESQFGESCCAVANLKKDIRDVTSDDLRGCEAVIHLAGLSNDPLGDIDPQLTMDINLNGTIHLAEKAKKAGVRYFLFASSCSIYGASGSEMLTEQSAVNPVTPYAHSKYLAETALKEMASPSFSPVFFRCATAHGYSPKIRFDLVINNLAAWAYTTGEVLIKSDGTPWRPFVHIEDICRSFLAVLQTPPQTVHNKVFNIGSTSENYQIKEVAAMVEEKIPGCTVKYAPDGGPDRRCYRVSCDLLPTAVPLFRPKWTIRESILDIYHHYSRLGLKKDDFEGPTYNRIRLVRRLLESGNVDSTLRWMKS